MKKKVIIISVISVIVLAIISVGIFFMLQKPKYTVTFNTDGGSFISSIEVKKGEIFELPDAPKKDGYKFISWVLSDGTPVLKGFEVTNDTILSAKWASEDAPTITITFDTDGGSLIDQMLIVKGEELKLPENPTKDGFEFVRWEDPTLMIIVNGAMLEEDTTLKAIWNEVQKDENKDDEKEDKKEDKKDENKVENENKANEPQAQEVKDVSPTGISLDKSSVDLIIGSSGKLNATIAPSNAQNKSVTWESSNPSVISVDSNGNLLANGIGNATIFAKTSNGLETHATVFSDVKDLSIKTPITYISNYGTSKAVTLTAQYSNTSSNINSSDFKWSIPDASGSSSAASCSINGTTCSINARDWWGSVKSINVEVSIGRKKASTVIYVEPQLQITKGSNDSPSSNNQNVYPKNAKMDLTTNIDVSWSAASSSLISSVITNNSKRYTAVLTNGNKYPQGFQITATSNAGQTQTQSITVTPV